MPLLEITQSRQISASVRLDEATATQVDQYAAFIKATADDVVDKALNYVFAKDRDFQDFLKTPQAKQISATLRVRKAPSSEVVEQPAFCLQQAYVAHRLAHAFLDQVRFAGRGAKGDQERGVEVQAVDEDACRRVREQGPL